MSLTNIACNLLQSLFRDGLSGCVLAEAFVADR
jgi:hypothetical protein